MDNDTTSLSKSLSSLAEGNRKVMSRPLSKDRKLDNNCFSPASGMKNTGSTDIPHCQRLENNVHLHKVSFSFLISF